MSVRAVVQFSGLASRPGDGVELLRVATDREGPDNGFWLDRDAEPPPDGVTVTIDGHHVTWQRADHSWCSARRRGYWFDDRLRLLG